MIRVLPGGRTSLQKHRERDEFWYVVSGQGTIQIGDMRQIAQAHQEYEIPRETIHRICGSGSMGLVILEVSRGAFDESDIERLEDDYART